MVLYFIIFAIIFICVRLMNNDFLLMEANYLSVTRDCAVVTESSSQYTPFWSLGVALFNKFFRQKIPLPASKLYTNYPGLRSDAGEAWVSSRFIYYCCY